jgi:hypothetical protein
MKAKRLFGLVILFSINIWYAACSDKNAANNSNNAVMNLLTAHVWVYDSVYTNWGLPNQSISFARTLNTNKQDYSGDRLKFYADGTFNEIISTGVLRQDLDKWTMSKDSILLYTTGGGYSNYVIIETLNRNRLVWFDPANKARGVQIPKY